MCALPTFVHVNGDLIECLRYLVPYKEENGLAFAEVPHVLVRAVGHGLIDLARLISRRIVWGYRCISVEVFTFRSFEPDFNQSLS